MPLHDWTDRSGWEGVHHLWISELLRWIKPRLPGEYRAYIGSAPTVAIGAPARKPDIGVRQAPQPSSEPEISTTGPQEPDEEIAVATLDPGKALYVERQGQLVAGVELVSPRNKDRPVARSTYLARYLGYLLEGVHLLLVDVHPRPLGFSFADQIAADFQITQPALPPPFAISYRVGEPAATGGRILGIWRRPLAADAPLPNLVLPLDLHVTVPIDLENTYQRAAADAYLT
ncbi:MAG TPA: DUF4058 family protein [Gemmataceae bacterium]|nr:DUF4058 family protein [Gemmataceae bacterium]